MLRTRQAPRVAPRAVVDGPRRRRRGAKELTPFPGVVMSLFLKDQWQEWARVWGLAHRPQKGLLARTERVVGERKGLLIRAGWGTRERPGLIVCVRFPLVVGLDRLRQALIDDDTLDALPGKGSAGRKMALER